MSYVKKNLIDGEEILYQASTHWFILIPSFLDAMFLAIFKECLHDEGITETKSLFYHMRDDGRNDPRVKSGKISEAPTIS